MFPKAEDLLPGIVGRMLNNRMKELNYGYMSSIHIKSAVQIRVVSGTGAAEAGCALFFSLLQRPRGEVRQKSVALMVHVVDLLLKLAECTPSTARCRESALRAALIRVLGVPNWAMSKPAPFRVRAPSPKSSRSRLR